MVPKRLIILDAGVEFLHVRDYEGENPRSFVIANNDQTKLLLRQNDLWDVLKDEKTGLYLTGKLADIVRDTVEKGEVIMPSAALWAKARSLLKKPENNKVSSLGIIDLSASGYMVIAVNQDGQLKDDLLVTNPRCGAGSGINLSRILEKLDIKREEVDNILKDYLGIKGEQKRKQVSVRADRCGVFSSSATISDKNQGIPLEAALAVTMKSEVLKACKKMLPKVEKVYLSGRVFKWQFVRDCAVDYLRGIGTSEVVYDEDQLMLIDGVQSLVKAVGPGKFRKQDKYKLKKPAKLVEYPGFTALQKKYERSGLYKRLEDPVVPEINPQELSQKPVNIGLDVGSTMAKMIITDATSDQLLFKSSCDNHGDTVETIKQIFKELQDRGVASLNIQNIGVTGSGRFQVRKVLQKVYPAIADRVSALVENYAHAYGSLQFARDHIKALKKEGQEVNQDFCLLVDIGGEDTKVSVISLKKEELFDNVMNIKCSAGTGSLMDTLKTLFGIDDISTACRKAYDAPRAFEINATCAVFLMENAKKMQSEGYGKDEILASCNYAIVENMARTLWNQIDFPENTVVLLHGQTMLSDPLPLAVTRRIQEETKGYCLVPPLPGHRACLGLVKSLERQEIKENPCALVDFLNLEFNKTIITCRGAVCGDKEACCSRALLTSRSVDNKLSVVLGGCSAINELGGGEKKEKGLDAYQDIWQFIDARLPKSKAQNRLVIPRSFAVSEQAFFLAKIFEHFKIPVYVDNVQESDILKAQSEFEIDVCAPLIGVTGQFKRLAREKHGMILAPQVDYLPTQGTSRGRTCTTNQGGIAIATDWAKRKYPQANFFLVDISIKKVAPGYLVNQLYKKLMPVFDYYKADISKESLRKAISKAIEEDQALRHGIASEVTEKVAQAIKEQRNIAVVCAREYILNPGIYDSHVGRLLRDKGIVAIPSYALDSRLDQEFGYVYWRNPHDLISKVNAITKRRLHTRLQDRRLQKLFKLIETGQTRSQLSVVQVSTFRCGADTVTSPTMTEMTKNSPTLYIQSDAMIKELAHLENRVNTYVNQLNKKLHQEFTGQPFEVKMLDQFGSPPINKKTDVVYFPTLHDNRIVTSVIRGAGITVFDNYQDGQYDLESKIRLGRKYAGDTVCSPMAGVFADVVLAVEDFKRRKKNNDPKVAGKKRVLIFDIKGNGPCRQGQYYAMHKLLLGQKLGATTGQYKPGPEDPEPRLLVGLQEHGYNVGLEDWGLVQAFQGLILQGVLHSLLLKAGAGCRDGEEYRKFYREYCWMKEKIYEHLEKTTRPKDGVLKTARRLDKISKVLGGLYKYFGYGLYNNSGLRKILKDFSKKWVGSDSQDTGKKIKVHIEGEAYMRAAQVEDIFNVLVDAVGFQALAVSYTPLWSFLELLLEYAQLELKSDAKIYQGLASDTDDSQKRKTLQNKIGRKKRLVLLTRVATKVIKSIIVTPLYKAARVTEPHPVREVLEHTREILPTVKPRGELPPYIGEAIIKMSEGTDLFLNIAPEGCMVSSMGQLYSQSIEKLTGNRGRIQGMFSLNGELDEEGLTTSLLKILGPEKYYSNVKFRTLSVPGQHDRIK